MKRTLLLITAAGLSWLQALGGDDAGRKTRVPGPAGQNSAGGPELQQWLAKTDELPPDFDQFPRINGSGPCGFLNGRPVRPRGVAEPARRDPAMYEKYMWGRFGRSRSWTGWAIGGPRVVRRNVRLEFGRRQGSIRVQ